MAESNEQKQFTKDILKAKAKYRKKRRVVVLFFMTIALCGILIQTYIYSNNKKQLNADLKKQEEEITRLDKEYQVNEVVIDKLKDPYFISDLVRQEYGVSYNGEIIFNLPLKDKFMQTTIKSIMDGKIEKSDNGQNRIDDSKLVANTKSSEETTNSDNKVEQEGASSSSSDKNTTKNKNNSSTSSANNNTAANNSTNAATNTTKKTN